MIYPPLLPGDKSIRIVLQPGCILTDGEGALQSLYILQVGEPELVFFPICLTVLNDKCRIPQKGLVCPLHTAECGHKVSKRDIVEVIYFVQSLTEQNDIIVLFLFIQVLYHHRKELSTFFLFFIYFRQFAQFQHIYYSCFVLSPYL